MNYLLAIDAGTGSVRAVLFDTQGKQIAFSQEEWTHVGEEGVQGSMRFDCEANWQKVISCIRKVLHVSGVAPNTIAGVSATSMREGIVVYDKAGKELWAVANVDARAHKEVCSLQEHFPHAQKEWYALSGQTFALGALPRLLWLKHNNKALYDRVAHLSMISDWVLYKLCGIIASEPSNAGTTGIFSLKERTWDTSIAQTVGINPDIFPPCYEAGTPLGKLAQKACDETGLDKNTLVVVGGGDVQLGSAGLGVVREGDSAILGGSFWQQIVNIPHTMPPPSSMSVRINPHVISTLSQAEGITFFSGLVMRWFRDAFCAEEKHLAHAQGLDAYELLETMAQEVPLGSYGILPIFSDRMNYAQWYHASPSFLNLSLDPARCNKASLFRALEENACLVSRINLDSIEHFTGLTCKRIIFAGGASKGFLWPQILADTLGATVVIPKIKEATALGAAIAAGVGCGIYQDIASAALELVVFENELEPNLSNHKRYAAIKEQWQCAYEKQRTLVDEGITTSMWKAPGV